MAAPLIGVAVRTVAGGGARRGGLGRLAGGGGKGGGGGQVTVDAKPFLEYLKKLQSKFRPPTTMGRVIEGEFLAMLKGATARSRMKRSTRQKAGGKYNPTSSFFKGWVSLNGKKYYVGPTRKGLKGFRYSDSMWAKLQERLKANKKRAETRVGLAKAVFYRVAADLRLRRYGSGWQDADVIQTSYLDSGGIGSSGKNGPVWSTNRVAKSKKSLRGNSPYITFTITSTNTYNPFTRAKGNVESAMRSRMKAFGAAMDKDAFKNSKLLAGFFPNIHVKK